MNLNLIKNKNNEEIANFIALSINKQLEKNNKVLWFVSGGSSIAVEVLVSKKINEDLSDRLVVTLADERFGDMGHSDSNWAKLIDSGFKINKIKMIPFLLGKDIRKTTEDIIKLLSHEFKKADYKIGVFGIGIDGHTAGILPHTFSVGSKEIVCTYETDLHNRITITPQTIEKLDEAVLYAMGENKWPLIEILEKDILIDDCPAQILKKVPLLTIFTDFKKNE